MAYQIKEFSEMTGLSAHTLRYYEKEGLLQNVGRNAVGVRLYSDTDLEWVGLIHCLKVSGMSVKEIRQFIDWCQLGDDTLGQRLEMFLHRKQMVLSQIQALETSLARVEGKIAYYEKAVATRDQALKKQDA